MFAYELVGFGNVWEYSFDYGLAIQCRPHCLLLRSRGQKNVRLISDFTLDAFPVLVSGVVDIIAALEDIRVEVAHVLDSIMVI